MEILHPQEIDRIEQDFPLGLSARKVVEIFQPKGVQLSEATFRKYVQAGLLPRSRRVGRKGKHRGSQGLYPVAVIRRINAIKKMMAEGSTLEDIRQSFVFFKNYIDAVERGLEEVLTGFAAQLKERPFAREQRKALKSQIEDLQKRSEELIRDLARVGSIVTARSQVAEEPLKMSGPVFGTG